MLFRLPRPTSSAWCPALRLPSLFLLIAGLLTVVPSAEAQFFRSSVGGVYVDAEGVISAPAADETEKLQAVWQSGLQPVPADLEPLTELRFVSLRKLDAQIAAADESGEPLPDSVRYLAGLLRVKHVLVYPPTADGQPGDMVLAGPAEGWKVDSLGNTVGQTTGRPVLMLDDLVVALRAAESSNGPGISCSIDPTPKGLANAQRVQRGLVPGDSPQTAARRLEQAIGRQVISIAGVPGTSHYARTMVAADFRMKRLAMGFEPVPIGGLPSYLQMINPRSVKRNLLPRWWLAADYEPLARDAEGLAWEIRGQGVKCLAEEDFVSASGKIEQGKGRATEARKWADLLTERFDELADHDSSFAHLRNAMDLSVAVALMAKEGLWGVAGCETPWLSAEYQLEKYDTPRQVATKASFLKKGNKWIITASGGVQFYPWQVADRVEESADLAPLREQAAATQTDAWWWQ